MRNWEVDLFSDTKTRPTAAMRAAMAAAEVGDEQQDEDPTVASLNLRVAALLGKEAAVFLPSGTMANVIATLVHCKRGDEILAEASSHVLHLETGGPAGIAGATVTALPGEGGMFSPHTLLSAIRLPRRNAPRPRVVWIEQTTNLGGGRVWPLTTLRVIRKIADEANMAVHIDGARLLNAAVADRVSPADYGSVSDSLWIDFTKGLGAPFGAVLVGHNEFIEDARRYKHMLGGAMRQAGIMAAACHVALDDGVDRLIEDHDHARALASALSCVDGLPPISNVETNIVILELAGTRFDAMKVRDHLASIGIRVGVFGTSTIRMVTHRDVGPNEIEQAIAGFATVFGTKDCSGLRAQP